MKEGVILDHSFRELSPICWSITLGRIMKARTLRQLTLVVNLKEGNSSGKREPQLKNCLPQTGL